MSRPHPMTSPMLVGGAGVKSERSESPATPKALLTAETKSKQCNSGEAETQPQTKVTRCRRRRKKMIMTETRTPGDIDTLLTTGEVAELLRVNRSTLSRWRSSGLGPRVTWLSPSVPVTSKPTWRTGCGGWQRDDSP